MKITSALRATTAVMLATIAALAGEPLSADAGARGSRRCAGRVTVTNPTIAKLIATDITTSGPIFCRRAKLEIKGFLRKKLQPDERCAEAADDPPYRGCHVRRFTCRGSTRLLNAQGCFAGAITVTFREHDIPLG